jgi:hypothetical protein
MKKRTKVIWCIAAAAVVSLLLFVVIYPHTTGPVLRHPENAVIRYIEYNYNPGGEDAGGTKLEWDSLTQEQSEKILLFLSQCRQTHTFQRDWTWNGDRIIRPYPNHSQRYGMTIMIDMPSGCRGILLSNDDICGDGHMNLTYDAGPFHLGSYFHFQGNLTNPGEIRAYILSVLDVDPAVLPQE